MTKHRVAIALDDDVWVQACNAVNPDQRPEDFNLLVNRLLKEHFQKEETAKTEKMVAEFLKPDVRLVKSPFNKDRWVGASVEDREMVHLIWKNFLRAGEEDAFREAASAYQGGICIEWVE